MEIRLILFDMDGVLFEGHNFWLELHEQFGTKAEGISLANKFLKSNYRLLADHVLINLWKGKPASVYWKLIHERRYQPGVHELFDFLHNKKIQSAIISSGSYDLALRAKKELGVDEIYANRLMIENDIISDKIEIMVQDSQKGEVGLDIMRKMGVDRSNTAFVGDSDSDIPLAKVAGLPISYDSKSESLNRECRYLLKYGELKKCIDIINGIV